MEPNNQNNNNYALVLFESIKRGADILLQKHGKNNIYAEFESILISSVFALEYLALKNNELYKKINMNFIELLIDHSDKINISDKINSISIVFISERIILFKEQVLSSLRNNLYIPSKITYNIINPLNTSGGETEDLFLNVETKFLLLEQLKIVRGVVDLILIECG